MAGWAGLGWGAGLGGWAECGAGLGGAGGWSWAGGGAGLGLGSAGWVGYPETEIGFFENETEFDSFENGKVCLHRTT